MDRRIMFAALLAGTFALGACKKDPPAQLPPEPAPSTSAGIGDSTAGQFGAPTPGTQAHFEQAIGGQNVIYFDTDRYNIDTADAAALQAQAQYLGQLPGVTVTVAGHADERGTREYNLALGERRANSAKNYLVGLGVSAARIRTVSYGKERPVATGSNESAWAQNRRAVTMVIN